MKEKFTDEEMGKLAEMLGVEEREVCLTTINNAERYAKELFNRIITNKRINSARAALDLYNDCAGFPQHQSLALTELEKWLKKLLRETNKKDDVIWVFKNAPIILNKLKKEALEKLLKMESEE